MQKQTIMTKRSTLIMLGALAVVLFLPPMFPGISLGGHESKVKEMIEKGDHAGLAEYYKKEAEDAKHKADGMKEMANDYLKKYPKNTYAKHCEKMEERYRAEAKDLEALAEQHSKAGKGK